MTKKEKQLYEDEYQKKIRKCEHKNTTHQNSRGDKEYCFDCRKYIKICKN